MRKLIQLFLSLAVLISLFHPNIVSNVLAQTPTNDVGASISFSPSTIALQGFSRLRINIFNNASSDFLSTAFANTLPAGLVVDDPANMVSNCGGSVTAIANGNTISLTGGTVGTNATCTISVNIRATVSGNHTVTINAGDLTGTIGGNSFTNADSASAILNVATFDFNAEINKSFDPINIAPGDVSRLSVSIFNSNSFELENASWVDDLIGVQPGLSIADPPNINTTDCGPSPVVSAIPGDTTLTLSGATVPARVGSINGTCTVQVDVTSTTPGNQINTIPGGILSATGNNGTITISNTDPASATLVVDTITPPSVTKGFNPNTIWVGQNSRLTIRMTNNDLIHDLTQVSLTDVLNDPAPHNVVLAATINPSLSGCGTSAVLTAVSGSDTLAISNATITPGSTCQIQVNVTSAIQGEYTNSIPIGAIQNRQGVSNSTIAEADLNVQAVGITKSFSPTTILAGEISTLTITLSNPTASDFTDVQLTDIMPGDDLILEPGTAATTCGSGSAAITTTNRPNDTISLGGGIIPAGSITSPGICTITVGVTTADSALTASHLNQIPAGSLITDQGITNVLPASATLNIQALSIGVVKRFSPSSFEQNGTSILSITLQNRTSSIIHVTEFIDQLPSGLVPNPATASTTCANGQATAVIGPPASLALMGLDASGAQIPPGTVANPGECVFSVEVTASSPGTYNNTIPANSIVTVEGLTNLDETSRSVTVYTEGFGMSGSKSFTPTSIAAGANSRLRITLNAPADKAITDLSLTDELPAGVIISNSTAAFTNCGGSLIAPTGGDTITLTGGSIAQGGSCRIDVWVTSSTSGTYTNRVYAANIDNDQNQKPPNDFTANLTVSNMEIRKAFYPNTIAPGGRSTLTITLTNTSTSPLVNVAITQDNLGTMGGTDITIASPANASTTCGTGAITANPGSQIISMSNGIIPAQVGSVSGICTVKVDVVASTSTSPLPTTRTNTLFRTNVSGTISGTSTIIIPVANATAPLTVTSLTLGVVKGFSPLTVFGGSSSTMSVQLINPNNVVLTGITFTDTMPAGMFIANPPNPSTGACGGTLTAVPGAGSFTFEGGVLEPGRRCTLTISATMDVNGNRTNTIPAGGVTSFNGASNLQAAQASLTNLPGASITKFFTPNNMVLGETSSLTIQVKNTGNIALSNMGLIDNLPSGLIIANSPAPINECNGTLTAVPGTNTIQLGAGSIMAGPGTTCDIVVPIQGNSAGVFTNTIVNNTLQTAEGATNTEPASDTLTISASPNLQIEKELNIGASSPVPFTSGDQLVFTLVATNTGNVNLTNVTIADSGATINSCSPAQPATLSPGQFMVCVATYAVTDADETAGTYTNIATSESDQTNPVTDSVTTPINQSDILRINKSITSSGPYELGNTLTYTITVSNIGASNLNNVTVSDPGVSLDTCVPAQPATLLPGDSMECSASHVVTQADVDAGFFSNTAIANSDETGPVSDSVTVRIEDNARLQVFKQVTSTGPYNFVGKRITYEISAINSGDITLTNVIITDPGVGVTLGPCTPSQPAILATGQVLTCSAYHDVTADDLVAGGYINTAFADSDQTGPVSGSAEVITQTPSISLEKTGTLDLGGDGRADEGDTINYTFTVRNAGEVTLTNITIIDIVGGVTISGGPIASLAPGESDSTTFTGTYTLTQDDVDAGSFTNTASVIGTPPVGANVSALDNDIQSFSSDSIIGIAKRVFESPNEVSPGVWDVSFEFLVRNYGNVTLTGIQVIDNLSLTFPLPTTFSVQSIESSDFSVNPAFDGLLDLNLLDGTDSLSSGQQGTISLVVQVTPDDGGPFNNSAIASGQPPTGGPESDTSQDGADPDPDNDGDPTNNDTPTPVDFGPNLFDPPYGEKVFDDSNLPMLRWQLLLINYTNIVNINASVSDPIPDGTVFQAVGSASGTGVPPGSPFGSTDVGVICSAGASTETITRWCYYEGPSPQYTLGRIVWEGVLGPDLGITDPALASNALTIDFVVMIDKGVREVLNLATVGVDRDGDGVISGDDEVEAITIRRRWTNWPAELPATGFAPNEMTILPKQPAEYAYTDLQDLRLIIPNLGVDLPIVGVPQSVDGAWDITWLGQQAGWLNGTAFPTWKGNSAVTAHVYDANGLPGPFANLQQLKWGDQILVRAWGQNYIYEVREVRDWVLPIDVGVITPEDYPWLTLITCKGYDESIRAYNWRVVVRAVQVGIK